MKAGRIRDWLTNSRLVNRQYVISAKELIDAKRRLNFEGARTVRIVQDDKFMTRKLNKRQERFVQEYMVDLNATQAAIRAGYSKRISYSLGQLLLKHVEVQRRLQAEQAKRAE